MLLRRSWHRLDRPRVVEPVIPVEVIAEELDNPRDVPPTGQINMKLRCENYALLIEFLVMYPSGR